MKKTNAQWLAHPAEMMQKRKTAEALIRLSNRENNTLRLLKARQAEYCLRKAYRLLKEAGCPQTTKRVRATLKSAQGAVRHAEGRLSR